MKTKSTTGSIPLINAAIFGNASICLTLLDHGADIEVKDKTGKTPLHHAAHYGDIHICHIMLNNGANIEAKDESGQTPLDHAVNAEKEKMCLTLIANFASADNIDSKNTNIKKILKMTPLEAAVLLGGSELILKTLNNDRQPETRNIRVSKSISFAIENNKNEVANLLQSWLTKNDALNAINEIKQLPNINSKAI